MQKCTLIKTVSQGHVYMQGLFVYVQRESIMYVYATMDDLWQCTCHTTVTGSEELQF
jgi:hypothetical protein